MTEAESRPVYMLVLADLEDRAPMADYARAMQELKLYEKHEGYYTAFGKPLEVFEGEWADHQPVVMARFPSLAHAKAFWYSPEYQHQVKPLRAGAGSFRVAVFEELDVPPRIQWHRRD